MQRLHVIGRKNHGKTTLIVDLVQAFSERGLRVGTIKHTHHRHELDTPGKDSHRHRIAGAEIVGIISPSLHALFWRDTHLAEHAADPYDSFNHMMSALDLVLVEGDTEARGRKLEVWRAELGTAPIAADRQDVGAIVGDTPPATICNCISFRRDDLDGICDWILRES